MKKVRFDGKSGKWKGKGFYVALAVCLIAVGVGAFSAMNSVKPQELDPDLLSNNLTSIHFTTAEEVENRVTGVPAETTTAPTTVPKTTEAKTTVATTTKSKTASFFVLPIGGSVIKKFDDKQFQFSETYNDWRLHTGVDIAVKKGEEVRSSGDGQVKDVYNDPIWGYTVVIDHGNGITAYYQGLSEKILVKKNDVVQANDPLGAVDTIPSESVEETHLHFAMKEDGKWVDPLKKIEVNEE